MRAACLGRSPMTRRTPALCFIALALVVRAASAQTADEIVARNIQAKGGLEKLRALNTSKQVTRGTIQGKEMTVTIYAKRPGMSRQEIAVEGTKVVMAFDGSTAWIINPLLGPDPVVMTGPQANMI